MVKTTFPGMCKALCPTPPSALLTKPSWVAVFLRLTCVVVFLLWAEFYTVCQSPERHTLEGPVEWDTKSDPPREQLPPTTPTSVCLSLFIFLLLSSSYILFIPLAYAFFPLSLSSSLHLTPLTTPQTPGQVCASQIPSVWKGYATSVGAFSHWSGRPSPANIPQHASQRVCN